MSGQIFISYRRDDASYPAGRLYDRLSAHFLQNQIFIDVDNLEPGADFVEAIEASVGSCDAFIAVIGKRWLSSSDEEGKPRLDNPDDFVRLEIATALKRNIRVIPVLVDGALMPRSSDLPDDLKLLVRRNAVEVSHSRFNPDLGRLIAALEKVLEKADAERQQREEKDRVEADRLQREENERLEAQRRENDEKQKLEIQLRQAAETERLEVSSRLKEQQERLEAEQREKERLETERLEKERLDALRLENERQQTELPEAKEGKSKENEQLGAVKRERPSRGSKIWLKELEKQIDEEAPTPVADKILRKEAEERERKRLAEKGRLDAEQRKDRIGPDKGFRRFPQLLRKYKTVLVLGATAVIIVSSLSFFGRNFGTPAVVSVETMGVLTQGVATIHENQWFDLERGTAIPDGDFTWRNESGPVLVPSSGSGFAFLKQEIDQKGFEGITEMELSNQTFINGKIIVVGTLNATVHLQVGEVYSYLIKGKYRGKFLVKSEAPNLVISFVTYK
jgi:hypothetical protein